MTTDKKSETLLGLLRLTLGMIFLWAFLDKLFGLGFATPSAKSWLMGGSPTTGFLKMAAKGPFASFFHGLAGSPLVDWLFMLGLFGIGVALILGIGMQLATRSGAIMVVLMYATVLPPENNPLLDEHVIYFFLFLLLGVTGAGDFLGFGHRWKNSTIVQRFPFLA
ncbi:MAG: hypothetical protein ABI747_03655 [Candidatus Moraniibacteriota bacterium]